MPSRLAAALASLAVLTSPAAAHASHSDARLPLRLTMDAPAECPDRQAFLQQLQARSSRIREAQADEGAPSMRIELRRRDEQIYGTLIVGQLGGQLDREERRREVRGTDCESVAAGLALVAVVILDPSAALSIDAASVAQPILEAPSPTQSPRAPASVLSGSSPSAPPPPPLGRISSPARLSAGAALELALGLGPDPDIVPRAFIDLELPSPIARASARLSMGRGYPHAVDTAIGTAQITLTDVRFEPCVEVWSPGALRLRTCGIVEGGLLGGEGTNTTSPKSENRDFLELGVGLRPTWVVHEQVIVGVFLAGAVPLARYRFYFASPDTTAYRLAAWSGFGELSVGVYFW
jgi:hypothetical protein